MVKIILSSAAVILLAAASAVDAASNTCGVKVSNYLIQGDEIARSPFVSQDDCCQKCTDDSSCVAFATGGAWKGQNATCSLMKNIKYHDATSGYTFDSTLMNMNTDCQVQLWGQCGDSNGVTCCPSGSFCQPWNSHYYQCVPELSQCDALQTDVDFAGYDLYRLVAHSAGECCEACNKERDCRAFTYINENPDGPWCYLKTSGYGLVPKKGAVSGLRKTALPASQPHSLRT